ncbi:MAG TPA: hypothetical protein VKB75_17490, partial [Jatrophihabitans sp.]|nr:hypothetical protein [Jatrophihabitans sp.]
VIRYIAFASHVAIASISRCRDLWPAIRVIRHFFALFGRRWDGRKPPHPPELSRCVYRFATLAVLVARGSSLRLRPLPSR